MGAVGVWALAIGIADLVAPTAARSEDPSDLATRRFQVALGVLVLVALLGAVGIGLPFLQLLVLLVITVVSGGLWLWAWRRGTERGALVALAAGFVVMLVTAGRWREAAAPPLARLLEGSPFVPLVSIGYVVLVMGLASLLIATGNRIVRVLLTQVEQGLPSQEQQLKGGRVIGPLERVLIFGLGITGQMVAAGLVVTAKSLLRFSELRHRSSEDRDLSAPARAELMSEYLLVGSLLSWGLAFAAIGLAATTSG